MTEKKTTKKSEPKNKKANNEKELKPIFENEAEAQAHLFACMMTSLRNLGVEMPDEDTMSEREYEIKDKAITLLIEGAMVYASEVALMYSQGKIPLPIERDDDFDAVAERERAIKAITGALENLGLDGGISEFSKVLGEEKEKADE